MASGAAPEAITRLIDELVERREQVVARIVRAIAPVDAEHPVAVELKPTAGMAFDAIVASIVEGRPLGPDDVSFIRPDIRPSVLRGVSDAEILVAPHHVHRVLWDAIVEIAAGSDEGRRAIIELAPVLMDYFEASIQVAAEAVDDIRQALSSRASIVRFELLEDLLAGRQPGAGTKLSVARGCGLEVDSPVVVAVARAVEPPKDDAAVAVGARKLARAAADSLEPLATVRGDEIVLVRATAPNDAVKFADALAEAQRSLLGDELTLAIAASAVHQGLDSVPHAYEEACVALESMGDRPGVLALPALSTLEYLLLRAGDRTAWQLVAPRVRDFVEDDAASGGSLIDTFMAYVENGLSAKSAAARLHVHSNTVHYRLTKIEERAECDLHDFNDLEQLAIAIRLVRGTSMPGGDRTHSDL